MCSAPVQLKNNENKQGAVRMTEEKIVKKNIGAPSVGAHGALDMNAARGGDAAASADKTAAAANGGTGGANGAVGGAVVGSVTGGVVGGAAGGSAAGGVVGGAAGGVANGVVGGAANGAVGGAANGAVGGAAGGVANGAVVGDAVGELEAAQQRISALEAELSAVKNGQGEAEKLQIKIDELQKVLDGKQAAEEAERAEKSIRERFGAVTGGAEFLNSYTRDGVLAEFRAAVSDAANAGRSDAEIYRDITDGQESLFVPDGGIPSVVASSGFGLCGGSLGDSDVREIMGLSAKRL